jgi:glycosyltransferase involved in cell wall biosynthesis
MAAATRCIDLMGAVPPEDMPAVYAEADIFCLPSWWEAMPLSLLEAMAAGLPVVASAVGDVPRAVDDEVSGMLVPPRDPTRLAAALVCLLLDPQMRERQGRAGRERAEREFSVERTIDALDTVYSSLCKEPR